jgi:spermidine synthase
MYLSSIESTVQTFQDARMQGVMASLLLFAPTSFLIGILSPYLVKLRVTSLQTSGQSFASLSALESIGGITGTFITGFILFGHIGAREAFVAIVLLLLVTSWLIAPARRWQLRLGVSIVIVLFCLGGLQLNSKNEIDTASAHYSIMEGFSHGRLARGISTGPNGTQSGVYVDNPNELLFWYTQRMADLVKAAPHHDRILVLGGGAFTLPQYLANTYPDSQIDVVEIDPQLADIARQRFYFKDPANVQLIFEDARTYVNRAQQPYDIILVDVYSDASVPFSLMTAEYGQHIKRLLNKDGVVGVNMIAARSGACSALLTAMDAPYRQHLPAVQYMIESPELSKSNIIVSYSAQPFTWPGAAPLDLRTAKPYTDNYAPAERLQQNCQNSV